jgi:hypothetical protein
MNPPIRFVALTAEQVAHAAMVGQGREDAVAGWATPDNGKDSVTMNTMGAMAEIAVCLYYGVDWKTTVNVLDHRPGHIPDVVIQGWKVSVKATNTWNNPTLIAPANDTANHAWMLVSVDVDDGVCGLRGWIDRPRLLTYPAEAWRQWGKWPDRYPGKDRPQKLRRYVPCADLMSCKPIGEHGQVHASA